MVTESNDTTITKKKMSRKSNFILSSLVKQYSRWAWPISSYVFSSRFTHWLIVWSYNARCAIALRKVRGSILTWKEITNDQNL